MIYIPQPQPNCFHSPTWPYVQCGGGLSMSNCHGCYKHYTTRDHIPHGGCSRCYDDGFGIGPYYRQGPFYRPGYSHVPSCFQMGTCGLQSMYGGYGGYGGMGYPFMGMDMGYGSGYGGYMGGYPMSNFGYPSYSYGSPNFYNSPVMNGPSDLYLNDGIPEEEEEKPSSHARITIDSTKKDDKKDDNSKQVEGSKTKTETKSKNEKSGTKEQKPNLSTTKENKSN